MGKRLGYFLGSMIGQRIHHTEPPSGFPYPEPSAMDDEQNSAAAWLAFREGDSSERMVDLGHPPGCNCRWCNYGA